MHPLIVLHVVLAVCDRFYLTGRIGARARKGDAEKSSIVRFIVAQYVQDMRRSAANQKEFLERMQKVHPPVGVNAGKQSIERNR